MCGCAGDETETAGVKEETQREAARECAVRWRGAHTSIPRSARGVAAVKEGRQCGGGMPVGENGRAMESSRSSGSE